MTAADWPDRFISSGGPLLVHAMTKLLKRLATEYTVEDGASFIAERDLRMDLVVPTGELLIDETHAEPQAATYLQRRSATNDGIAAATSKACRSAHYARPGCVSFDERIFKLTTLAVESFGPLGRNDEELLKQVATRVVGGEGGRGKTREGVLVERLRQVISTGLYRERSSDTGGLVCNDGRKGGQRSTLGRAPSIQSVGVEHVVIL